MTINNELKNYCRSAAGINSDNLMAILRDNKNTEFGSEHGFDKIESVEQYRNSIPLLGFDYYDKYIRRMRDGEENVLTVYPLAGFCRTSGSTGRSKYIPLSCEALERYSDYFERWRTEYLHSIGGQRFLVNTFRTDLSKPQAKEALFSEFYFRYIYEHGFMDMNEYIGGEKMIFADGEYDITYAKVREALCCPDFKLLECQFLYELLGFFDFLENNWNAILNDIGNKTVPEGINLPQKIIDYLNGMDVSPERLCEIRSECEKGFNGIAGRLWKNLLLVSGVSNRAYITEKSALNRYTGDISRYHLCYCASECYIGTPVDINSYEYLMLPQNAFYEFHPYDSKDEKTLLPHELKKGELYEPVITNFSGLYRYKMMDIVKITGYIDESPLMEFMFRKGQALNIAGEKYDTRQLEKSVFDLRNHGIDVNDYCFGACLDNIPGRYIAMLSVSDNKISEEKASELLDDMLCQNNGEYDDLRKLGALEKPSVIICRGDLFSEFMCSIGLRHRYGHNKPHHILKGEVSELTWRRMLKKTK